MRDNSGLEPVSVQVTRIVQELAASQSAAAELRETVGSARLAYGALIVREYLSAPRVFTGFTNEQLVQMLGHPAFLAISAGSPSVSGCVVAEDLRTFWVRRVLEDDTCRWHQVQVPTPLDILRLSDAEQLVSPEADLERALIAWGVLAPKPRTEED